MEIQFPYKDIPGMVVHDKNLMGVYEAERFNPRCSETEIISSALSSPTGTKRIKDSIKKEDKILIICDDNHRPTPVSRIIPYVIQELKEAKISDEDISFLMALGTHRPMTREEMESKLGEEICLKFKVENHKWDDKDSLIFMGQTTQGIEIWINKKLMEADFVIGIGRIMPIEVCGFTGGGKIVVPGVCGEKTNGDMHWVRVDISPGDIIGKRDNPIRKVIDDASRKAGLSFIVNIIMDNYGHIAGCAAGDLELAHRKGVEIAKKVHGVKMPEEADIVVVDGFPFDIEFWQVNKALDTAGIVVKKGGVVIIISPCYEGISKTHSKEILKFGYRPKEEIKQLVENGKIKPPVIGVHMIQVAEVLFEKRAKIIMVTNGISPSDISKMGFLYAENPQSALTKAFEITGENAKVAVLKHAAEMLPILN